MTGSKKEMYGFGDYNVTEINHFSIQLTDGVHLTGRLWIPDLRDAGSGQFSSQFSDFNTNTTDTVMVEQDGVLDTEDPDTILVEGQVLDDKEVFPVILEYLPYYKDILTFERDINRHPWFASHGFVVMRVELRGTGSSGGLYYGEYTHQEMRDCSEVLRWVARQGWSNGKVGMYGKSWGGFNGLQVGYLEPDTSPLKTAISLYSTDNRYTDDVHYEGGCPIGGGLLSWASAMFSMDALPPIPRFFTSREKWHDTWMERLKKTSKSCMSVWLNHQLPSAFWDHGSIDTNYDKVTMPVLAIGGLEDGYTTAAERMARKLNKDSKVIIGPWDHNWPDVAGNGPRIDYLNLCLNWFSYHLKGVVTDADNPCTGWPRLQLYIRNSFKPSETLCDPENGSVKEDLGRFVKFDDWVERGEQVQEEMKSLINNDEVEGSQLVKEILFKAGPDGNHELLFENNTTDQEQDTEDFVELTPNGLEGANCGTWFRMGYGYSGDQTTSITNSASFKSAPLPAPVTMIGVSALRLTLTSSSWERVYIAVRVSDEFPDGTATLVTRSQHDLNYLDIIRENRERGTRTYALPMRCVSHSFQPGNRIVISVSPNYFPMLWPSFVKADVAVLPSEAKFIYQTESVDYMEENEVVFEPPKPLFSLPDMIKTLSDPISSYSVSHIGDKVRFIFNENTGMRHFLHQANIKHQERFHEQYECDTDLTTALAKIHQEIIVVFGGLHFEDSEDTEIGLKINTHQVLEGDREAYRLEEKICVSSLDSGEEVFRECWTDVIPRLDHNTWR